MKRGCLIALVLTVLVLLLVGGCGVSSYNGLVASQESIDAKFQEIENQYKRRFDLIPPLVETVKGAANFEQDTLQGVTEARASVAQARLPEGVPTDPQKMEAYVQAQQGLGAALSRLFAVAENYPNLTATANFRDLQVQIEGTENRIAVARNDYINAVRAYNTNRRSFPAMLFASAMGFEAAPQLFLSDEPFETPARDRPDVQFGGGDDGNGK